MDAQVWEVMFEKSLKDSQDFKEVGQERSWVECRVGAKLWEGPGGRLVDEQDRIVGGV